MQTRSISRENGWSAPGERLGRFVREHERTFLGLFVLVVEVVPYFAINLFNEGRPAVFLTTWVDELIPLQKGWEFPYSSFELLALLPFLMVRDLRLLRRIAAAYAVVFAVAYALFLAFPVEMLRVVDRQGTSFVDWGIRLNHAIDPPYNCFPSLHVAISVTAAWGLWKADRVVGTLAAMLAAAIVCSTVLLKQHCVVDVVGGLALAAFAGRRFFSTFEAGGRPLAFPRARVLLMPAAYASGVAVLFLAFSSGVEVPRASWAARDADIARAVPVAAPAAAASVVHLDARASR